MSEQPAFTLSLWWTNRCALHSPFVSLGRQPRKLQSVIDIAAIIRLRQREIARRCGASEVVHVKTVRVKGNLEGEQKTFEQQHLEVGFLRIVSGTRQRYKVGDVWGLVLALDSQRYLDLILCSFLVLSLVGRGNHEVVAAVGNWLGLLYVVEIQGDFHFSTFLWFKGLTPSGRLSPNFIYFISIPKVFISLSTLLDVSLV